jgi:glycosyltransferase involved in cell wall biosynthesis
MVPFASDAAPPGGPPADGGRREGMNPSRLRELLLADVIEQVTLAEATFLRGFEVPRHYGGHPVGPDARADIAFTLGLLWENGIREVAGRSIPQALRTVLFAIDGPSTHTFFSYRVAETLARFGPLTGNSLLAGASDAQIENLVRACDATASAESVRAGRLPRNHAAVLARCEVARRRLGLPHDASLLDEMLERTRQMLAARPGRLDDSQSGNGRFDLYSADTYLFCEPIADSIGPTWEQGARGMLEWVRRVASEDGCAVAWGRSTGALGVCHTIELGALALRHRLTELPPIWLALAANARQRLKAWFSSGVTTAHQRRSSDPYRGPRRRLQLTFDLLGKLADSARHLRSAPPVEAAPRGQAFPERDELVWFDQDKGACVWSYRSEQLSFALPVTGCTISDYLPAPRSPGLFEGQAGSDQAVAVPFVFARTGRHVGAGLPTAVSKSPGGLELTFEGWPVAGDFDGERQVRPLPGRRVVKFSVQGSTFRADESLQLAETPLAVGMQIAEAIDRPLRVSYQCPSPSAACLVDTGGMSEWRSFWGELPAVHQLDIAPTTSVAFSWSMTPKLRVLTSEASLNHDYHRTIYDTLPAEVAESAIPVILPRAPDALRALLARGDVFHLHWPEWILGRALATHRRLIAALEEACVPVVWTMHNLEPHDRPPGGEEIYRAWASAAAAVAHHSRWGLQQALARYPFRPDALHAVIAHPHFGPSPPRLRADREAVERELGLRPDVLRLGIVGAPRREKRIDVVSQAVRACARTDLELLILSLGPEEQVGADPRVRAFPHTFVSRTEYDRRLAAIDVVVLPFAETGMLTTGTVGDVVGHGLPALASDWPFLKEVLGDAAIGYGSTPEQLTACLETLTAEELARAAAHSRELQAVYAPRRIGQELLALLSRAARRRSRP